MSDIKGQEGELRFTLEIKRAATGKTETVEMIGKIGDIEDKQIGEQYVSDTLDSGA